MACHLDVIYIFCNHIVCMHGENDSYFFMCYYCLYNCSLLLVIILLSDKVLYANNHWRFSDFYNRMPFNCKDNCCCLRLDFACDVTNIRLLSLNSLEEFTKSTLQFHSSPPSQDAHNRRHFVQFHFYYKFITMIHFLLRTQLPSLACIHILFWINFLVLNNKHYRKILVWFHRFCSKTIHDYILINSTLSMPFTLLHFFSVNLNVNRELLLSILILLLCFLHDIMKFNLIKMKLLCDKVWWRHAGRSLFLQFKWNENQ